jgi:hypothetical protein
VIKATRRAATQLEFKISPSAYEEARSAARRMHDLLSDGHETWRDWQARDITLHQPRSIHPEPSHAR